MTATWNNLRPGTGLSAQHVHNTVARYLLSRGWFQDGDTPGVWRRHDGTEPFPAAEDGATVGAAFDWQTVKDRVDTSGLFPAGDVDPVVAAHNYLPYTHHDGCGCGTPAQKHG